MTPSDFRKLALQLPEAVESAHMNHPDFRVGGRIFASLGPPRSGWGMVKLTPQQQQSFIRSSPEAFAPCQGAWGRRGATHVRLAAAGRAVVRDALTAAWLNTAPKRLIEAQTRSEPS